MPEAKDKEDNMKKLASVLAMAGLGLVISGCSWLPFFGGGGGGGNDMAKMMKDSAQAPWQVQVHDGAAVGQYAVIEMAGGTKQWWGVTGTKDDMNVVEMRMDMAGQGWITYAYVVDGEGNVKQAFIANYDPEAEEPEEGYEIKIMEKQDAAGGDAPEPEKGEETVNAAGRDWECTWYKTEHGKTWMAEKDGWFNKIVKSEDASGNTVMKLVEIGEDATLGLKWPGEGGGE